MCLGTQSAMESKDLKSGCRATGNVTEGGCLVSHGPSKDRTSSNSCSPLEITHPQPHAHPAEHGQNVHAQGRGYVQKR
eukprot:CAMPEP_0183426500 /NCGR_PEP_ID=MMETSP0370-20130417/39736_1 /TAXON_ID=268820 /ORGANISM="Peridinium aciculiferum, Strain PAER-2" /LENGTH=77 /DNA_ID=CAMNT_0025610925 /DNA_START=21 /DNA_END=250 /DNA_ORIENTATION=+